MRKWPSAEKNDRYLPIAVALAFAVGLARRLLLDWDTPLWLDEIYTGAIAAQPSFVILIRDCIHELGGPVYYLMMWLWVNLVGASNLALRLPSLFFAISAPLLLLRGHPDRRVSLLWASLAALWIPGYYFATEARSYSLLFFLGCLQAIAIERLIRSPGGKNALAWSSVSALLILTHFHTIIVTFFQGVAFLILCRKEAVRRWPATLVFIPVGAWMIFQVPLLLRFADPQVAWQQILPPHQILTLPDLLLGGGLLATLIFLFVGVTVPAAVYLRLRGRPPLTEQPDIAVIAASALAIGVVFGLGFLRPSFAFRYLIPFIPGLLLGISVWARNWTSRWPLLPYLLILAFSGATLTEMASLLRRPHANWRWNYSWQIASQDLEARGIRRLYFFLDNPTTKIADRDQIARVGGFFFQRDRVAISVQPIVLASLPDKPDPNEFFMTIDSQPHDAFIWAYDRAVNGTLAIEHPPRLAELDERWACRDYGRGAVTILVCAARADSSKSIGTPRPAATEQFEPSQLPR